MWVRLPCNYPLLHSAFRHPLISHTMHNMLWHLPSSLPCGMHHCAINQFPNGRSVLVCTADDCDLSRLSRVVAIRLVPDRKWSLHIPGNLIAIKCWSRQALASTLQYLLRRRQRLNNNTHMVAIFPAPLIGWPLILWQFTNQCPGHQLASWFCVFVPSTASLVINLRNIVTYESAQYAQVIQLSSGTNSFYIQQHTTTAYIHTVPGRSGGCTVHMLVAMESLLLNN